MPTTNGLDCGFFSLKTRDQQSDQSKKIIFVKTVVNGLMISPEEYNRKKDDDEELEKLPTTAVVVIIVLAGLVGVFIVCEAIFGL